MYQYFLTYKMDQDLLILFCIKDTKKYISFILEYRYTRNIKAWLYFKMIIFLPFQISSEQLRVSKCFIMGLLITMPFAFKFSTTSKLRCILSIWIALLLLLSIIVPCVVLKSAAVVPLQINSISFPLCETSEEKTKIQ